MPALQRESKIIIPIIIRYIDPSDALLEFLFECLIPSLNIVLIIIDLHHFILEFIDLNILAQFRPEWHLNCTSLTVLRRL
jgi:hypothetical protein